MTPERLEEIRALAESLEAEAHADIEDKREIWQALIDLIESPPTIEYHEE